MGKGLVSGQGLSLADLPRRAILGIAARHGATDLMVFGSFARGEADAGSDLDLLVVAGEETSPWFPAGLVLELEELLGREVDVVLRDGLHWLIRERVVREAVSL